MKLTTISQFNGGIVNGVAATKLNPTTASDMLDADIRYGDIRSVASHTKASAVPKDWEFQNGARSIVKFGENTYWVDNITGEVGSTLGYLGVEFPESPITVTGKDRGDRFVGKYKYTSTFESPHGFESRAAVMGIAFNTVAESSLRASGLEEVASIEVLLASSSDFDAKSKLSLSFLTLSTRHGGLPESYIAVGVDGAKVAPKTVGSAFFQAKVYQSENSSIGVRGYNEGQLVKFGGAIYRAKSTFYAMSQFSRLPYVKTGSTKEYVTTGPTYRGRPTTNIVTVDVISLLDEIQPWQYPDGSGGSEFWTLINDSIDPDDYSGFDSVLLSNLPQPKGDYIQTINIYRTVGDGDTYFLCAKIPAGQGSWLDTLSDEDLVSGPLLDFAPFGPPVMTVSPDGIGRRLPFQYLTEQLEQFYCAAGSRVYISEQSNPHRWDVRKFVALDAPCTGIAKYRDGVLAFTRNRTYQITGSTLADIQMRWIPEYQGCKDWRTISYSNNNPTWISNDGLCQYGFVPDIQAEILQTLTLGKFDWPDSFTWATVSNKQYIAFTPYGYAVVYDFQRDGAISKISADALFGEYGAELDQVVFKDPFGDDMVLNGGSTNKEWRYSTPSFTFESNQLKKMRSCWVRCDSDVEIKIEADGVEKFSGVTRYTGLAYRRMFFSAGLTGTQFRFTLVSSGTLDQLTIEWSETRK